MKESPLGRDAHQFFLDVQQKITDGLSTVDGRGFRADDWTREGEGDGGGGRTMVISDGHVFEKGGVNVSCVYGELSEAFAKDLPGSGRSFFATGVSLVLHPRNPHCPTVHANFRYLEKGTDAAWFGGGSDLTPWVLYDEDAIHFHGTWRSVCERHPIADFGKLKRACDEYFFLPHRKETRGIGGIFFDYFGLPPPMGTPVDMASAFRFVKDAAASFLDAYIPIVERRSGAPYDDAERSWQLLRRGRYVEFNLIYDRGTIFGLKTGGRVESILMSLPALVRWSYDARPEPFTYQERLVEVLQSPRDWV